MTFLFGKGLTGWFQAASTRQTSCAQGQPDEGIREDLIVALSIRICHVQANETHTLASC